MDPRPQYSEGAVSVPTGLDSAEKGLAHSCVHVAGVIWGFTTDLGAGLRRIWGLVYDGVRGVRACVFGGRLRVMCAWGD